VDPGGIGGYIPPMASDPHDTDHPAPRWRARSFEPVPPEDVRRCRQISGWTQAEAARHLEMPLRTYSAYETGETKGARGRGMPRASWLAMRAAVYAHVVARGVGGIPGWPPPDLATLETLAREAELLARKRRRE